MLLICGAGRGVSRGQDGGVAEVVCPPLGWWCVQGACSKPCFSPKCFFLQALHKWQLGFSFFFFGLFVSLSGVGPKCTSTNFFAFCCWRRHVSMYKHCSKGSQVPVCFIIRRGVTNKQDPAAKRTQAEKVDRGEGASCHFHV